MTSPKSHGGRMRVKLPALNNTVSAPPCGEILHTAPPGIATEAQVVIDSETITISARDLKRVADLGRGYYGYVQKMIHPLTRREFAVKHMRVHQETANNDKILKDISVGTRSRCPSVVTCYCGLYHDQEVWVVMELMDTSLDKLLEKVNAAKRSFPEDILAYMMHCVVTGLEYLHKELKVIHRDVKPSNMLTEKLGSVKVCDFGISGDLVNSVAQSNIGSKTYLAPERIKSEGNRGYGIQSDVWSLGLSVIELATGEPCYVNIEDVFEQLERVVKGSPPRLSREDGYSEKLCTFTARCLVKDERQRANYVELLDTDFLSSVDQKAEKKQLELFLRDFLDTST